MVDRAGANCAHWAARSNKLNVLKLIADKKPDLLASRNRDGKLPKEMCFSSDVSRYYSESERQRKMRHITPPGSKIVAFCVVSLSFREPIRGLPQGRRFQVPSAVLGVSCSKSNPETKDMAPIIWRRQYVVADTLVRVCARTDTQ
jgi:hypothetical protein